MAAKKSHSLLSILLIVFLFASLVNVQVVRADGETPTEPPAATEAATEVATEAPVESTPEPVVATPAPEEATPVPTASEIPESAPSDVPEAESTPVSGILSDVPEDTNLVVLDEQGQPLALGSQETAEAVVKSDPVWCPASVFPPTPGANGCSANYASIAELLLAMRTTPADFDEDGTIYLERTGEDGSPGYAPFTTPLILDNTSESLGSAYSTLSTFNLTIRGGWDQTAIDPFSGENTHFDASGANQGYIRVGSALNPWVGSVTIKDITVRQASLANGVTIYTSSGDITLSDVDVEEQNGEQYSAYLSTQSGDIVVKDRGSYDGNDTGAATNMSRGFYASSGTGSITITGTGTSFTFRDSEGANPPNYNGATLSAPTVTLNNVWADENDANGIAISGASLVTLNSVVSGRNINNQGNGGSGILVNGTGSTVVNLFGGTLADNGRYGIEILNAILYVHEAPICPTTGPTANGLGCYNVTPATPTTEPTPTEPTPTEPTPTEPTPTEPTPTEPTPTEATPTPPTAVPTEATPTAPASGTSTPPAPGSANPPGSQSAAQNAIIPLTGGGLVDLSCNSVFWAGGVKLSFINLCDHQTSVEGVSADNLPGELPAGASLVAGLDVTVLSNGQAIETLPAGAGIQMDFPTGAGAEYAVLYWDESSGEWIQVSQELNSGEASQALNGSEGLFQLVDDVADLFLQILTTDKTGIFVLVQK